MKFSAAIILTGSLVFSAYSQSTAPRSATSESSAAKPKATASGARKPGEAAEWDKANAVTDPVKRIAALKKFVTSFPKSTKLAEALGLIVESEAAIGNEMLAAGDGPAAAEFMKAAAADAPKPVGEKLFTDTLSKFPANLYFHGMRDYGFEIAKILQGKADTNASQLLQIATFYLTVENGSEARRVTESAIKADPNSSAAYQTLGLANRVDFKLEESAAAFQKALELDPDSLTARRGLAEMKRSLGKSDEAVALYREILAKEETNVPARTGLILALLDADKRADAEAEMARSLEANPGNVMLLAGAAYWYAAHAEGAQAVALAQKAIDTDPRFIWSHIALARGFLTQNRPLDAEKTLLAARRYGNFPTLEYEIASARLAAGLYREAVEELTKSFSIKDGVIRTNLGGRVPGESKNFSELIAFERRASIFAPTAADNPADAAQLKTLLEFKHAVDSPDTTQDAVAAAADNFMDGDDQMKVHRQIFAASELLDKKINLPKVVEIAKNASSNIDRGLEVAEPATAVLASELYESRAIAVARGQYINVSPVPRQTLSAVLRGRVEEISGWALYQMDDAAQATVHLKRAAAVLPTDSAWWRSSLWKLGTALVVSGNDREGLEVYIRSYKSGGALDPVRYNAIESLYKRVNGNTNGLEENIGPNPSPSTTAPVAQERAPEIMAPSPSPMVTSTAERPAGGSEPPVVAGGSTQPSVSSKSFAKQERPTIPDAVPAIVPIATATQAAVPLVQKADPSPEPSPEVVIKEQPEPANTSSAIPAATPAIVADIPRSESPPTSATREEIKPVAVSEPSGKPAQESPEVKKAVDEKPQETPAADRKPTVTPTELFPPIIIKIPAPKAAKLAKEGTASTEPEPKASPSAEKPSAAEIKSCSLTVSEESLTLRNGGGGLAVIVGRGGDENIDGLTAVSTSPEDVSVRRETIEGVSTRALFVVRSISTKTGPYQIRFELPCGKKELVVNVQ